MKNKDKEKILERIQGLKNKDRKARTVSLTGHAYDTLSNFCKENNVTFSAIIDEHVKDLAKEIKEKEEEKASK